MMNSPSVGNLIKAKEEYEHIRNHHMNMQKQQKDYEKVILNSQRNNHGNDMDVMEKKEKKLKRKGKLSVCNLKNIPFLDEVRTSPRLMTHNNHQ